QTTQEACGECPRLKQGSRFRLNLLFQSLKVSCVATLLVTQSISGQQSQLGNLIPGNAGIDQRKEARASADITVGAHREVQLEDLLQVSDVTRTELSPDGDL